MPRSRLRRPPGRLALGFCVVVAAAGSFGLLTAAQDTADEVERVENLQEVLSANEGAAENYLLVGSDSREGIEEGSAEAAVVGTGDEITGRRSDTIMILRRQRDGGAALLSIPRDLWVEISGTDEEGKINSAYNGGPQRLAATVSDALGIPIHHYVEVDFTGFTRMVDAIGGVEICFEHPARDILSGLLVDPGCRQLPGDQALAYARSRHYEEWIDGEWQEVGVADLGRIERQQHFIREAVSQVLAEISSNPFRLNELITAAAASVRIDEGADVVKAANALRDAAGAGLATYTLPVEFIEEDGQSALELGDGAEALLDYFRGVGPAPATTTTTTPATG